MKIVSHKFRYGYNLLTFTISTTAAYFTMHTVDVSDYLNLIKIRSASLDHYCRI